MVSDQMKTVSGAILLVVSSVLLVAAGIVDLIPLVLAALATTGLAIGSLLIGTTGEGPTV
jgi:hypothetical protein